MCGHLTDLKIWLFARSEEGENIKITCKKAWKIISHNKLSNFFKFLNFFQFLNGNIYAPIICFHHPPEGGQTTGI
jgi:hypothetical protein